MELNPKFISVDFKIGARGGNTKKNHILTLLSSTPQLYNVPTFIVVIIMLVIINIIIFTIPHNSSLFKDFTLTVNTNTTTMTIPTTSTTITTTT